MAPEPSDMAWILALKCWKKKTFEFRKRHQSLDLVMRSTFQHRNVQKKMSESRKKLWLLGHLYFGAEELQKKIDLTWRNTLGCQPARSQGQNLAPGWFNSGHYCRPSAWWWVPKSWHRSLAKKNGLTQRNTPGPQPCNGCQILAPKFCKKKKGSTWSNTSGPQPGNECQISAPKSCKKNCLTRSNTSEP